MGEQADITLENGDDAYFAHLDGDCGPLCEYCRYLALPAQQQRLAARRLEAEEARRLRNG